jgi:5'-3' exonuclease
MVTVNPRKPIMLIDTSYYIFYRYYAVFNWYKLARQTTLDVPTILSNPSFMEKFDKLFEDNLEKLRKSHNIDYSNIIFAKDCIRDHIWRYKHFAQYKKSRDDRLSSFNGDIFKHCYGTLLPHLAIKRKVQSCEHWCAEADDIVAVFTRHIHSVFPDTKIVVVTNDNDYLQLINDNTMIVDMKNRDLKQRLTTTPEAYLKLKIIMGDKSDNIPPILSKCGEKRAQQLADDANMLAEKMENEETRERFELNTLLIDTTKIPDDIQNEIKNMLEFEK